MGVKVTVVTVCYNAQDTIADTIESVVSQTYVNMEYIIVDGASTDKTVPIISGYIEKGSGIKLISERDSGLYDAMNKGANFATGDYIVYMNSGDRFVDKDVIADMSESLSGDITYGNVIRVKEQGNNTEKYDNFNVKWELLKGRMICHQAMFIKSDLMRQYGYDCSFKITADFNFLCRCVRDKRKLNYVDRDIVVMDNICGISSDSANLDTMRAEDDRSIRACFPVWYEILRPAKYIKRKIV